MTINQAERAYLLPREKLYFHEMNWVSENQTLTCAGKIAICTVGVFSILNAAWGIYMIEEGIRHPVARIKENCGDFRVLYLPVGVMLLVTILAIDAFAVIMVRDAKRGVRETFLNERYSTIEPPQGLCPKRCKAAMEISFFIALLATGVFTTYYFYQHGNRCTEPIQIGKIVGPILLEITPLYFAARLPATINHLKS